MYTRLGPFVDGRAPYLSAATFNHFEDGIAGGPAPTGGDDTAALQAWLTGLAGFTGQLGGGTYRISAPLNLPATASLLVDPQTTIRATATMSAMLNVASTTSQWIDQTLTGGLWDCNNLAASAIYVPYALNGQIRSLRWTNPTSHGVILGDTAAASTTHELIVSGLKGNRTIGAAPPAGSYGIWMKNAYDSVVENCIVVGAARSFRNDCNGNTFSSCHGYGLGGGALQYPVAVFSENGSDSEYRSCYADTPSAYGWEILANAWRTRILGGLVYLNIDSPDNVVVGIHTVNANPNQLSILGVEFSGQTARNRLAKDYDGTVPAPGLTAAGNLSGTAATNVAVANLAPHHGVPTATAVGASGAGTSPPAPIVAATAADYRGTVTFGTGTSAAAGTILFVTFAQAYQVAPTVVLSPRNFVTQQLGLFVQGTSTTSFSVTAANTPASSQANTVYQFDWIVAQ